MSAGKAGIAYQGRRWPNKLTKLERGPSARFVAFLNAHNGSLSE